MIGHLNINSIRNKFDFLITLVKGHFDLLMINETKIHDSFPSSQFKMDGYTVYRLDRNDKGGGIILFARENLITKYLNRHSFPNDLEAFFIELNLRKKKWLICCCYIPNKGLAKRYLEEFRNRINYFSTEYENIIFMGDFNAEITEPEMMSFCNMYDLKSLIKEPTCYKNPNNPSCIDLFLTNSPSSFQNTGVIETGLSDFHKMIVTFMKSNAPREPPKIVTYRDYSNYNKDNFEADLFAKISRENTKSMDYETFKDDFLEILHRYAPVKRKYLRANHSGFITKELSKAIMLRSKTRNRYLKTKTEEDKIKYKKQRNICVSMLRKAKRRYYENLDLSNRFKGKDFWKAVKPLFGDKVKSRSTITLVDDTNVITDEKEIADTFNKFYVNIVSSLGISKTNCSHLSNLKEIENRFENHPSIIAIKEYSEQNNLKFSFHNTTKEKVKSEIKKLNVKKAIRSNDIPTEIIKEHDDLFSEFIEANFNFCKNNGKFPNDLQVAEIFPTYKNKGENTDKTNYRPISILSNISKIYERIMYEQIEDYFNDILSKYQCGFRKGHNAQNCLLLMIEKIRMIRDNKGAFAAVLTDLLKAFDCIPHDLLIAKLKAYGFDEQALKFIMAYLNGRKQKVKVGSTFSDLLNIIFGVPQGSILGPLLFIIFVCDLFFVLSNVDCVSYADDTTPYVYGQNFDNVIDILETNMNDLFNWFSINGVIANSGKSHLLVSPFENKSIKIKNSEIVASRSELLLGLTIDSNLTFEEHINTLCKKANQKLHALSIANYMTLDKRRILLTTFITSQFNYCPLVWMSCSRALNHKINRVHERALRIVYNNYKSSFLELLQIGNSFTIHQRNIQYLATEIYKASRGLSPIIMNDIFVSKESSVYNLRHGVHLNRVNIKTTNFGIESITNIGAKIWDKVPKDIKDSESLAIFKSKIKKWVPENCPCRICKTYIKGIGYI